MRSVFSIALHDLRLTVTDRGAVIWMLAFPIVFATFFGLVLGGEPPSQGVASLAVVDLDSSVISSKLIADLEGEGVELTKLTSEDWAAGGNAIRTLVIPTGFGSGVLAGEQQTLRLEKQPDTSQEAALVAQARIIAAVTRLLGRLIEASSDLEEGVALQTEDYATIEEPDDLVIVNTSVAGRASVIPSGFAQSIPGNAVMFVLLIALTYGSASISAERTSGNLRRLVTAPVSRAEIIAGKIAGRFVVSALQITVLVVVGVIANRTVGIFIGDHPVQTWLVLLLFAATVAPLGVALGGWITEPDRAANIGVILTMVMAAFGGCYWPIEVVSKPLKTVALLFPTGWTMRALHGLISFGQSLSEIAPNLVALAGFAMVFTALAARSLKVD